MTMTRTRAALLLAGLFLLGAACGAFATCALVRHGHFGHGPFAFGRSGQMEEHIVRRLTRRLDLDEAQRDALRAAVARARVDIDRVRDETLPRVEAIIERAFDEVATSLRPDQRDKLDRLRQHTRERMRRHHGPGAPGPADPPECPEGGCS